MEPSKKICLNKKILSFFFFCFVLFWLTDLDLAGGGYVRQWGELRHSNRQVSKDICVIVQMKLLYP